MASTTVQEAGSDFKVTVKVGNPSGNITGIKGERGIQGERGVQGIPGIQGPKGDTGLKGDTGAQGIEGKQGIQGIKGDRGIKGDTGSQGVQGVKGDKGDTGEGAYQEALSEGFTGTKKEWLNSLRGERGYTGTVGPKGDTGNTGLRGPQGVMGDRGPRGYQGLQGKQGVQGLKGEKGTMGSRGSQGEKGDKGDDAVVADSLGTSTVFAVSQKLLTDEVDKMTTSIATIKNQSDESIVKVDTNTLELQTSIAAILGINKKLTNRINALEESNIYEMFNSSDGIWLDPSDLKTMFQNSRGATPVTKDGDPVGLILDKSQGLESGDMDFKTVKGGFNSSEWVIYPENIDSSGRLVMFPTSSRVIYKTTKPLLKNKTYKIEVEIDESINVNFGIRIFYTNTNLGGTYTISSYLGAKGVHTYYIRFSGIEEGYIGVDRINSHTGEVYINSVSVTEVKGNHALQPLAASRPTYRTDGVLHWLQFDGTDDYLVTTVKQYADFSYYTAASSFHSNSLQVIMGGRSGTNNRSHIGHQRGSVAAGVGELQGLHLQIAEQFTQDSIVLGSLVYDANTVRLRQNNTKTFQVDLTGSPLPPQDNFIGALSTSGTPSSFLKGSIYGIIAINSAEYKEYVKNYLANKTGVEI